MKPRRLDFDVPPCRLALEFGDGAPPQHAEQDTGARPVQPTALKLCTGLAAATRHGLTQAVRVTVRVQVIGVAFLKNCPDRKSHWASSPAGGN